MNRNKVVIVVLVLIVALYLASLIMGVRFNVGTNAVPAGDEVKDSWVHYLSAPLSLLAPNLLRCNRQPVDETFTLTEAENQCDVKIPEYNTENSDNRSRVLRATLEVLDPAVSVYERSDAAARSPECRSDAQLKERLMLKVAYLPKGGTHREPACWLARNQSAPVKLIILRDGGVLKLSCEGCGQAMNRSIRLRLKGSFQ